MRKRTISNIQKYALIITLSFNEPFSGHYLISLHGLMIWKSISIGTILESNSGQVSCNNCSPTGWWSQFWGCSSNCSPTGFWCQFWEWFPNCSPTDFWCQFWECSPNCSQTDFWGQFWECSPDCNFWCWVVPTVWQSSEVPCHPK